MVVTLECYRLQKISIFNLDIRVSFPFLCIIIEMWYIFPNRLPSVRRHTRRSRRNQRCFCIR